MSSHYNKPWGLANESLIQTLESELPQSTLYWLLISICAAIAWAVYLTYYNSRVFGLILTAIINRFIKFGHVHVGQCYSRSCKSFVNFNFNLVFKIF